jgi:hypothetical protein
VPNRVEVRSGLADLVRLATVAVLAAAFAGCAGPSAISPGSTASQPFAAVPLSLAFATTQTLPQAARVALRGDGSSGAAAAFTVSVDDPTQVGAAVASGGTALVVTPISSGRTGATSVHVANAGGAETIVTASEGLCGRADNLAPGSTIIYPRNGARGVSTHVGKLYFAIFSQKAAPAARLHLIVGSHGTLEGSRLMKAVAPRGAASVEPRTGLALTVMAATVPELPAASLLHAQVYDDACQPPLIAGTFRT